MWVCRDPPPPPTSAPTSTTLENEDLTPYEAFFSKLRNNNTLDKDSKDCQNLRSSGLDEQPALKKLQFKTVSAAG